MSPFETKTYCSLQDLEKDGYEPVSQFSAEAIVKEIREISFFIVEFPNRVVSFKGRTWVADIRKIEEEK